MTIRDNRGEGEEPPKGAMDNVVGGLAAGRRDSRKHPAENIEVASPAVTERLLRALYAQQNEIESWNEALLRAPIELDEARARYFDLYNLAPVGYVTLSESGLILDANLTVAKLLGVPPESLEGQPLSQFVAEERQQEFAMLRGRLLGTGESQSEDFPMLKRDGAKFWMHLDGTVAHDHRNVATVRLVLSDITARKKSEESLAAAKTIAEAALRESEALHSTLDQHAIVSVADARGRIIAVNPAFCAISGYRREELLGQDHRVLNSGHHAKSFWVEMWRKISEGESWRGEVCNRAKDGTLYWVDSIISPFKGPDGKIEKYVSIRHDITDRKRAEVALRQSEARLREAQRIGRIGSWERELPSNKLTGSDTVFETFEIDTRRFGATYEAFLAAIHPEDREMVESAHRESVLTRIPHEIVYRLIMPDGRVKHVQERGETYYNELGEPVRSLGTVQDITEHMRHEAELARARHREALATLSAGIAHEFNSMLLGAATYLYSVPSGPDGKVTKAVSLIQQAQSLSAALLELFAGPEQVEPPTLQIGEWLAEHVRKLAELQPPGLSIALQSVEGELEACADSLSLEQVLRILLTNAADAMEGQGRVEVKVRRAAADGNAGDWIDIRVSDSGPGITASDRNRVFEPFFTTRKRSRRSGLGLAIASRLVEQAGGSLSFEPNEPRGSTFVIRLRTATKGTP